MSGVSGNREPGLVQDMTVLLRAVALTMPATEMLYAAADLMMPGETTTAYVHNEAVLEFVARILDLPHNDPDVHLRIARVLANLPPHP